MRCPRCGNENPEENRFCGMCGATLLAPVPAGPQPVASPAAPTPSFGNGAARIPRSPQEPHLAPIPQDDEQHPPRSVGLLFSGSAIRHLGGRQRTRAVSASIRIGPGSAISITCSRMRKNTRRVGAWKYILILMALALAVGFGYLRFKNQGSRVVESCC